MLSQGTGHGGPVNWRQVGAFVGLTFGLTWLLDLLLFSTAGYRSAQAGLVLQLQMLLPAFSVMVLGLFVYRGSPIAASKGSARLFVLFFMLFTLVYVILAIGSLLYPQGTQLFTGLSLGLAALSLVVVIAIRLAAGRGALASIGLTGGKARDWFLYGLALALFYVVQSALNYLFGLGKPVDLGPLIGQTGMSTSVFLLAAGIQSVVLGPFLGLVISLGEEYGWRGYLQGELVKLGRAKGVFLVGLIWGVWHLPVIWMGHNYPGHPVFGSFLMVLYTLLLAFFLGYVVLKTGSVWLAAFLHAMNNQVYSFLSGLLYSPNDAAYSFGAGIYGVLIGAVIVVLLLRDPVWAEVGPDSRENGASIS